MACSIIYVLVSTYLPSNVGRLAQGVFSAASQLSGVEPPLRAASLRSFVRMDESDRSSTVMMWPNEFSLRQSTMAANVVDLSEPVAPTRMHRPRLVMVTSLSTRGTPRPSMVGKTRNHAHHAHAALLDEGIDTKTSNAGRRDGEVAFLGAFELGCLFVAS